MSAIFTCKYSNTIYIYIKYLAMYLEFKFT